jgi:hypothetical protein
MTSTEANEILRKGRNASGDDQWLRACGFMEASLKAAKVIDTLYHIKQESTDEVTRAQAENALDFYRHELLGIQS